MINLSSWNIRGLNQPHKQEEVRTLISSHKITLCGLNETKVRSARSSTIAKSLLPGWKFLFNYSKHKVGRIWVAWEPSQVSICLLSTTYQVIHTSVNILDSQQSFLASFVYGMNSDLERSTLWAELSTFSQSAHSQPWIVLGDFNSMRFPSEKVGGDISWDSAMESFNICCHATEIDDLKFTGHQLTWSNKNPNNPI